MSKIKKLRWFVVTDPEENICLVISAFSHSKAKIYYGTFITGDLDAWESLNSLKCNVVKQKMSIEPEKEFEDFEKRGGRKELVKEGIYSYAIDEECPHCGECSSVYFDNRFYCEECEDDTIEDAIEKGILSPEECNNGLSTYPSNN